MPSVAEIAEKGRALIPLKMAMFMKEHLYQESLRVTEFTATPQVRNIPVSSKGGNEMEEAPIPIPQATSMTAISSMANLTEKEFTPFPTAIYIRANLKTESEVVLEHTRMFPASNRVAFLKTANW